MDEGAAPYWWAYVEDADGARNLVRFSESDELDEDFTRPLPTAFQGDAQAVRWLARAEASGRRLPALYLPESGKLLLLHGGQYVRCTLATMTVDEGHPLPIGSTWPGLAAAGFADTVDTVLQWDGARAYFCKGTQCVEYDLAADRVVEAAAPQSIARLLGGPQQAGFDGDLDAAVRCDTEMYLFKGEHYARYDIGVGRIDPGHPSRIAAHWKALAQAGAVRVLSMWRAPRGAALPSLVPGAVRAITPVATSTPAFLGPGPGTVRTAEPVLVRGWEEFARLWEAPVPAGQLPREPGGSGPRPHVVMADAVHGYFGNGGGSCYVVPVAEEAPDYTEAVRSLEKLRDVAMVVTPALWLHTPDLAAARTVMQSVVTHCERAENRMAVLDAPPWTSTQAEAAGLRETLDIKSAHGALYYPWVMVSGHDGQERRVPPSGHVAGLWARVDTEHGVHRTHTNEPLSGVVDVPGVLSDAEVGALNEARVNCVRATAAAPVVWGARTLASDADYRRLNVRRVVSFLKESVDRGTVWAACEAKDERLWSAVTESVTCFLADQWHRGALAGRTATEAFHVTCDASNNTHAAAGSGQLRVDVGVAPVWAGVFLPFHVVQQAPAPTALASEGGRGERGRIARRLPAHLLGLKGLIGGRGWR
ncbi:phage tail sheath subtilisin-like domain-containing protein [Streptomyces melanogenes]|uniref:phage tail sheath subtilisin-like domain-containing protein n=1 Tax=Streptomyces melanogenes TaxID=67326 RepID=UPI001E51F530|nr:phage tail sheath subtilisin-like domain-containing protein [Streptomyces melanogenes]